jgi:hypothetical protein
VIDAAIRLWFTPKQSGLYQKVFGHLSYDDAKSLAHDSSKIRELYNPDYKKRRRVTWNLVDPADGECVREYACGCAGPRPWVCTHVHVTGLQLSRTVDAGKYMYCQFCWDGGELLLCDGMGADGEGCPQVMHAECTSVAPEDGQPFLCEDCRLLNHLDPTRFSFRDGSQSGEADPGGENFEVERILNYAIDTDQKTGRQTPMYLTQWKGWSAKHNTWEPRENLTNCPLVWEAFRQRCPEVRSRSLGGVHSLTLVEVKGKKRRK